MGYFAGLDLGSTRHAACVVDEHGKVVDQLEVRHDAEGLDWLIARLRRLGPAGALPIGIERPSGIVVAALAAAGPGRADPSERRQGDPAARSRRLAQERCRGCLHIGRSAAD